MPDKEKKLEHPRGGSTTKDATDLGAPMAPGEGPQGPEDALEAGNRGDYSGRVGEGQSYTIEPIPENERVPGGPTVRRVRQK